MRLPSRDHFLRSSESFQKRYETDAAVPEDDPTLSFQEKGRRSRSKRRLGINFICGEALRVYIERAGITKAPLFRARAASRSEKLSSRAMSQAAANSLEHDAYIGFIQKWLCHSSISTTRLYARQRSKPEN